VVEIKIPAKRKTIKFCKILDTQGRIIGVFFELSPRKLKEFKEAKITGKKLDRKGGFYLGFRKYFVLGRYAGKPIVIYIKEGKVEKVEVLDRQGEVIFVRYFGLNSSDSFPELMQKLKNLARRVASSYRIIDSTGGLRSHLESFYRQLSIVLDRPESACKGNVIKIRQIIEESLIDSAQRHLNSLSEKSHINGTQLTKRQDSAYRGGLNNEQIDQEIATAEKTEVTDWSEFSAYLRNALQFFDWLFGIFYMANPLRDKPIRIYLVRGDNLNFGGHTEPKLVDGRIQEITIYLQEGEDYQKVLVHELGASLGLDHKSNKLLETLYKDLVVDRKPLNNLGI
ncbi:MAG: hypothetical protein N2Z79_01100, partial [Candidatus Omnitrophica bacterium]|nr:hypothetical protein [Candidatus Omnitrophota bacterium]